MWKHKMKHNEFKFQAADKLQIYAQEWKPDSESAAVICLIHGKGEHSGRYSHLASVLTGAGYTLLAFDLRGHGKSQGKRGHSASYEVLMCDIAYFLKEATSRFTNLPLFLYGHSMGGNLALNYVIRRQVKLAGVIATSPWLSLAFKCSAWKSITAKILYKLFPSFAVCDNIDNKYLSRDPKVVSAYENDPLVHDKISVRLALDIIESGKWALENAGRLSLPLLLMHGTSDFMTSPEASRNFINRVSCDCTYKFWEGLYHEIHNEPEQKEVFEFMLQWLKAHQ